MDRRVRSLNVAVLVMCSLSSMGGSCDKASHMTGPAFVTNFTAGNWGYVITADSMGVPLVGNGGPKGCGPPNVSGTTAVSSGGAFSIQYTFAACDNCVESGTITATIAPLGPSDSFPTISGNVAISEQGSGCSIPDPPEPISGECTSTQCPAQTPGNTFYYVGVTLTPPGTS
jgi:hypothetical protein